MWLNSSLIRETQQVVVAVVVREVKEDRPPEVEDLPRRESGDGAPQLTLAVLGQLRHAAFRGFLDGEEYPGDEFGHLSEHKLCSGGQTEHSSDRSPRSEITKERIKVNI